MPKCSYCGRAITDSPLFVCASGSSPAYFSPACAKKLGYECHQHHTRLKAV